MSTPIIYGPNRLRTGTVSAATTTMGPLSRLWDGFAAILWAGTGPIVLDQGGTTLPFGAACFGPGHNLAGSMVTVVTDDNAGFSSPTTLGIAVLPAGTGAAQVVCGGPVERYTRVSFSGAPSPLQIGELSLAPALTAPRAPRMSTSPQRVPNRTDHETESGVLISSIKGPTRWETEWLIPFFDRTTRTDFQDGFAALDGGAQPCFLLDDEDTVRFVHWLSVTFAGGPKPQRYEGTFQFREALG